MVDEAVAPRQPVSQARQRVLDLFYKCFGGPDGDLNSLKLRSLLKSLRADFPESQLDAVVSAVRRQDGSLACQDFLNWVFDEASDTIASVRPAMEATAGEDAVTPQPQRERLKPLVDLCWGLLDSEDQWMRASFSIQLQRLTSEHRYLEPGCSTNPHPLHHWVTRCREAIEAKKYAEAQEHLRRVVAGLESDRQQSTEAFRRFDTDSSGHLDADECRHMCAYLGWGIEEAELLDLDRDGRITLPDFQTFIGRMGGVQQLFERRRLRISASRRDVCDYAGLAVGSRVRAHFYVRGQKSRSWREAQVLAVGVERRVDMGPATYGVFLEFGFGYSEKHRCWRARQVVPPTWVLSSVEDASIAAALREVGILGEHQAFWALLLPDSELHAIERLEDCQRNALHGVRALAVASHAEALPKVKNKFAGMGYGDREVEAVLSWIQDLAPICVHVHLDRMGHFLEVDEFYRNQFETKTSCGALDPENRTRKNWEHELFGGAYDEAKPFDRCKYGALNVVNDYRGVVRARGYGDSYLVLKDVRLRCTFASTDSGGIKGSRLAVLDHYGHVLAEYNDQELRNIVTVAVAAITPSNQDSAAVVPQMLRGSTEDPTMDWVTVGFPDLRQGSGRFYFEVELQKDCGTPQVGVLSSEFQCMPRVKNTQGVGDDANGWAVDGQNAARWHGGVARPWGQLWKTRSQGRPGGSVKLLTEEVVVGVAVDLDARTLRFSSNGEWDDRAAFGPEELPEGTFVYPALSVQGRAAFNFGPAFRHSLPSPPGEDARVDITSPFGRWPGTSGTIRIDEPRIGNEETLSIYKEVQIHGEVSLNRNVQRLVACQKYREMPKMQRSWALRVSNAGLCSGTYERAGMRNDMPLYRTAAGAVICSDKVRSRWWMNDTDAEDPDNWCFWAPVGEGATEPPRLGWKQPDEKLGMLPTTDIRATLQAEGFGDDGIDRLTTALGGKDTEGRDIVFRVKGLASFDEEWGKLGSASATPDGSKAPDEVWAAAIQGLKRRLLEEAGLANATVVETDHPYAPRRSSWKRSVELEDVYGLVIHFSGKSCTLDGKATFCIYAGGLRRESAGPGARVEVPVPGGDKVWATVVERSQGSGGAGFWKVRLDRQKQPEKVEKSGEWPSVGDLVEAKYKTGKYHRATVVEVREDGKVLLDWFDDIKKDREKPIEELRKPAERVSDHRNLEDLPRYSAVAAAGDCFASCCESPASIRVTYSSADSARDEQGLGAMIGDEIASFSLDRSCPLTPVTVAGFLAPGPAQNAGVEAGWFLDLVATLCGPSQEKIVRLLRGIGDDDLKDPTELLNAAFADIEELHRRLNVGLRGMSDVTLVFANSSSPSQVQLLPEAHVRYAEDQKVGDEMLQWGGSKNKVRIKSLARHGPAHEAGVRADWLLDVAKTLQDNPGLRPDISEAALLADPSALLAMCGVTLAFKTSSPDPVQKFMGSGSNAEKWKSCHLAGNRADFQFSTDGDGGDQPEKRWGVWALVVPKSDDKQVMSKEDAEAFATRWVEHTSKAAGEKLVPEAQRDGWDEARLRALCARHGWEFEWMTEDGERRRRMREQWNPMQVVEAALRPLDSDSAEPDGSATL